MAKKAASFEQGLERLEEIVLQLDGGEVPLDNAVALFEEGLDLTNHLKQQLDMVERKLHKARIRESGSNSMEDMETFPDLPEEERRAMHRETGNPRRSTKQQPSGDSDAPEEESSPSLF